MLSTACASYIINVRSPQNAYISFEAQHKIEVERALVPMLHHDLQSANYHALLMERHSNIRLR